MTSDEYQAYLESNHWIRVCLAAKDRAGWQCEYCSRNDVELEVHHRTYLRLGRERLRDLVVLCRPCHRYAHMRRFRPAAGQLRLPFGDSVPVDVPRRRQ